MAFWDKISSRGNVEDRRAAGPTLIGGGLGLGGVALLVIFNLLSGGNVGDILSELQNATVAQTTDYNAQDFEGSDSYEVFASTVLGSANEAWAKVFAANNQTYHEPKLVLFRGSTESACGGADARVGPHYCPYDHTIYLDETFFDELTQRFGAKGGDVAQAYVIAHEVGHHVQNEMGTLKEDATNEESIYTELQADCFAGLWAFSIKDLGVFEPGEISEALDAASAVGDDRIQEAVEGRVTPESWTHGSSAQRISAFTAGYDSGEISRCNV
jgi:predicted metalloprotease